MYLHICLAMMMVLVWCAWPVDVFAAVDGCYLMENNTDLYLMENGTDTYLIEGDDGGACGGAGVGPTRNVLMIGVG